VIVTDTVGFIRDLPPDLVNAFRATLEELRDADLLLHVVDASDPRHDERIAAVEEILRGLDLGEKRRVVVMNKIDRLPPGEGEAIAHRAGAIAISATTRAGIPSLLHACDRLLWAEGRVPFTEVEAGAPPPPPPAAGEAPPRLLPTVLRRVS
jgi:GTP-binding protein HflX